MATVDIDFRGETGANLNTDNAGNPACRFRFNDDASLPSQYQSVTIANSNADGVILVAPTGASAPACTEQTTGSPGSGNQHFINPVLWPTNGNAEVRHRLLFQIPAQMISNGINVREFTFILKQKPLVGGNDNAWVGVHFVVDSALTARHLVRLARSFNDGNFTADATTGDFITETTDFTTGDFLLLVAHSRLPLGVGGGSVVSGYDLYNMGAVLGDIEDMLDPANGTLIAESAGEFSFGGTDLDETNNYGFIGCSNSGTAVGPRLVYLRTEEYTVPALSAAAGFPACTAGDRVRFDAGCDSDVLIPVVLGRGGNPGSATLSVQTSPSTTGLTITVLEDPLLTSVGLIGVTAASGAQVGTGSFVLRATFADASTVDFTVNYETVGPLRDGSGESIYASAKPVSDVVAGSSTPQLAGDNVKTRKDLRTGGANSWTNPATSAEATLNFGIATSRADADWLPEESAGAASPGVMGRALAASLNPSNATRKWLAIVPVANILPGTPAATVKPVAAAWFQYPVDHQIDVLSQEVGIRLVSPTATGTAETGGSTSVIRCSGGTLSGVAGTYNGKWVTVEVGANLYEVAEIGTHTMDGGTLVLTLLTQEGQDTPLSAPPVNGNDVNIHSEALPQNIKTFNGYLEDFGDPLHADFISAPSGARVRHAKGNFNASLRYLDNTDGNWTHQSAAGQTALADLWVEQWTAEMLRRATVTLNDPGPLAPAGEFTFTGSVSGAANYGEDAFPANMIPLTYSVESGDGTIDPDTGEFVMGAEPSVVRATLDYNTDVYDEITVNLPESTPPEIDTATVDATGLSTTAIPTEAIEYDSPDPAHWEMVSGGEPVVISAVDFVDDEILFTHGQVYEGKTTTLNYLGGAGVIHDAAGNDMEAVDGIPVTNDSEVPQPGPEPEPEPEPVETLASIPQDLRAGRSYAQQNIRLLGGVAGRIPRFRGGRR